MNRDAVGVALARMKRAARIAAGVLRAGPVRAVDLRTSVSSDAVVASFDIFDTILTRSDLDPALLFDECGHRLRAAGLTRRTPEQWRLRRIQAERTADAALAPAAVRLSEIYDVLAPGERWSDAQRSRALAVETQTEREMLHPIAPIVRRIARLRARGTRVLLISDMYLDEETIAAALAGAGVGVPRNDLFISGCSRVTKRSGALFRLARERSGVGPGSIDHIGDNLWSDVIRARDAGFAGRLFTAIVPNRYERVIATIDDAVYASKIAGASRSARLAFAGGGDPTLWNVGTNVAGPFLTAYVSWVIRHASSHGLRRLYFLARDGELLVRIARRLVEHFGLDVECRYLYASRRAWHLPSLTEFDDHALTWIFGDVGNGTRTSDVFARVELDIASFAALLEAAGFPASTWRDPLSGDARARLIGVFADPALQAALRRRAALRRGPTLAYLRSEGLFDGTPSGIVDVGWNGRLQRSLSRLVTLSGSRAAAPPAGYYIGLNSVPDPARDGPSFTFIESRRSINATLVETFCAAAHGSVAGFTLVDGNAVPEFATLRNREALDWGLEEFQAAVAMFVDRLLAGWTSADLTRLQLALVPAALHVLHRFSERPSRAEAERFGAFPHAAGQMHHSIGMLAPRFDIAGKLRELVTGRKRRSVYHWVEGSLRRRFPGALVGVYRLWRRRSLPGIDVEARRELRRSIALIDAGGAGDAAGGPALSGVAARAPRSSAEAAAERRGPLAM